MSDWVLAHARAALSFLRTTPDHFITLAFGRNTQPLSSYHSRSIFNRILCLLQLLTFYLLQFDGEKDTRGPADFNNKQDDPADDDDDGDDDDAGKRSNFKGQQKPIRRDSGGRLPPNTKAAADNSSMGMGVSITDVYLTLRSLH